MHRAALVLVLVLAVVLLPAAEQLIVNPANQLAKLSAAEARALFTGAKTTWPDRASVVIALASDGAGNQALMAFLGKSTSQFLTAWKKKVFTGGGMMPTVLADDQAVAVFVAKTPGAIAMVALDALPAGVKQVAVE